MLINNANITGSLIVQGPTVLSGSLTVSGSTLNNLSASYALTASYVASVANLSTFQIATGSVTASVNINSGSFTIASGSTRRFFVSSSGNTILSGSLAVSNLTGSGVRYMLADAAGNITAQTASAAIRYSQTYTASAGQTTFSVTNGYTTGLVDVYINGSKLLDGPEYTDTSGTNIVLTTGSFAGDIVEIVSYQPASGVTNNSLRQLTSFTATAGQTTFSASYVPGLLDVFYNGSRLNTIEYTAANGNSIVLATGSAAGDLVDVLVYSYQVGAFSGIGGTGVANQVAYWNTTNSITGSPNFVVSSSVLILSGSSHIITGSVLVSGSIGIGTSPSFPLEISSTSVGLLGRFTSNQNEAQIRLVNTSAGGRSYSIGSGGTSSGGARGFYIYDETAGSAVFAISGSGNIGIGTTTPTGKLDVANRGITVGSMPVGSVIQVVSYKLVSSFSTTSTSDQDSGLKVSITPTSSTSKILVLVSANIRATSGGGNCYATCKLVRGAFDTGTSLHNGFAVIGNYGSTDIRGSLNYSYLDSPATTSSTQYVISMNSQYATTVYMDSTTTPSTITLMEIAQ